ncbi:MAG: alpha/beta hydrolase-fold protein [Lautropia sp.]|nr:alpha/beta hydrolase-fold protein [Lautropia sp.]
MDDPAADFEHPPGRLVETGPASLPSCAQHWVRSHHTGRRYRIQTTCAGPQPEQGYPVLYLLDGDTLFPIASTAAHALTTRTGENGVVPMLIVGIGYDHQRWLDTDARVEDYTPPVADGSASHDARGRRQGGADRFLRFLQDELLPETQRHFQIDSTRQALFGHSFGGLFTLHAFFRQPQTFQTYIASSPSLWWHHEYMLQQQAQFIRTQQGHAALQTRLHLSIGEYEQKHSPHISPDSPRAQMLQARGQVARVRAFFRQFQSGLPTLPVSLRELPEATHGSAQLYAILDALRLLGTPLPAQTADCRPAGNQPG